MINASGLTHVGRITFSRSNVFLGLLAGLIAVVGGVIMAFGGPIAAAAVILALVSVAVVLHDIELGFWGIVVVITLLPFATLPVDIGLIPTLLDMALAATAGVWALRIVTGKRRTLVTSPITLPLFLFFLVALFSLIFGMANGPLTSNLLRHFAELLVSIGFAIVIVDYFSKWGRLERMVKVVILAGTVAALLGIILWLLPDLTANSLLAALQRIGYPGGFVIRYIEENPELSERAISTSVDPNALGGLLLMIGALTAPQLVAKRPLFPSWMNLTIVGILFLCLVLTFSRGAMVGLAGGLGFIALVRYRKLFPYIVIAGAFFLLLPVTQGYVARFTEGFLGQDLATQMRFGEYRDALHLIGRYPLFGVGFAGSPDIDLYLGVANVYLTIAQQMGILGLLAFVAIILTVFSYAYFNRDVLKASPDKDPVWLGLHAAIVGGLVAGIFDHYLFNIDFHHAVTIFWLLLGLAVASTTIGRAKQPESS